MPKRITIQQAIEKLCEVNRTLQEAQLRTNEILTSMQIRLTELEQQQQQSQSVIVEFPDDSPEPTTYI